MNYGDSVMFRTRKASERWGRFTFEKVYTNESREEGNPRLRDDKGILWWIDGDDLEVVSNPDVTDGWSL